MSEEHKNCKYRFKGKSCEDCPLNCKLKRLQQELDIKEKMLDKFMIGSGETLEKLQKENEELKKYQYTQEYLQSEIEKRQKALEEIRNKLKKYDANIGDTIIANPIQDCYDTYKLINEVLK